jgi:hypothetical protein
LIRSSQTDGLVEIDVDIDALMLLDKHAEDTGLLESEGKLLLACGKIHVHSFLEMERVDVEVKKTRCIQSLWNTPNRTIGHCHRGRSGSDVQGQAEGVARNRR